MPSFYLLQTTTLNEPRTMFYPHWWVHLYKSGDESPDNRGDGSSDKAQGHQVVWSKGQSSAMGIPWCTTLLIKATNLYGRGEFCHWTVEELNDLDGPGKTSEHMNSACEIFVTRNYCHPDALSYISINWPRRRCCIGIAYVHRCWCW